MFPCGTRRVLYSKAIKVEAKSVVLRCFCHHLGMNVLERDDKVEAKGSSNSRRLTPTLTQTLGLASPFQSVSEWSKSR
jgi:hypothetical protein